MVDNQSKLTTTSVRIEETLMKRLDIVTQVTGINKSDFLRACLEKLCDDNQILIDHYGKISDYVNYIRSEVEGLPPEMVAIKNGSWKDVRESTIVMLCDELWKWSDVVYDHWVKLLKKYDIELKEDLDRSDGLLDVGAIAMITAERSGVIQSVDIGQIINDDDWVDSVEVERISLTYACKKAFEDESAQHIIAAYLEEQRKEKKEGQQRLVIDARGSLRRSGSLLYLPVDTEEIQKRK